MTELPPPAPSDLDELPRLDDRVRELLSEICGPVAFNGLRRALRVHPESLSRSLRRLAREGTVKRTAQGYRLVTDGSAQRPASLPSDLPTGAPVAELKLPPQDSPQEVLGRLSGRWFGDFRWVGFYEGPGNTTLLWTHRNDGSRLWLRIRGDVLEVFEDPPGKEGPAAAYQLLRHVLGAWHSARRPRGMATLSSDVPGRTWGPN